MTQFDIRSPEFNDIRYSVYEELIKNDPVHWHEPMNSWLITKFSDIQMLAKSPKASTASLIDDKLTDENLELGEGTRQVLSVIRTWMIYNENPTHGRLRKFMNQSFKRDHIERVLPYIKDIINERLQRAVEHDNQTLELDIIDTFAHPVPAQILKDMLGLDEIDLEYFLTWSDSIALFMQDFVVSPVPNNETAKQTASDMEDMVQAFRSAIQLRQEAPKNDLLSFLVQQIEGDSPEITEQELCNQLIHLIFGGHKIPQFVIGNTLNLLFQHPDVMQKVLNDEITILSVINEAMRVEGPIQYITRHATEDFELRGKQIKTGDSLFLVLGAGNRDGEVFDNPNTFNPSAGHRNNLAFGSGAHVCIGTSLVVSELEEIFKALLGAGYSMLPQFDIQSPDWTHNATFHGINSMPIKLEPRLIDAAE